jgi:hypothetical protein
VFYQGRAVHPRVWLGQLKGAQRRIVSKKHALLGLLAGWFIVVNLFALFAANRLNLQTDTAFTWIDPAKFVPHQTSDLVDLHVRWDGTWLLELARNGYHLEPNDTQSDLNFFPLYSGIVALIAHLIGGHYALAGWIVSTFFLVLAVRCFADLLARDHPTVDPERALYYLLIFPTAFVLNAVYTESLFLYLSLLLFYESGRARFWRAGIAGFLAGLTRPTGFLLAVPLLVEHFRQHGWAGRKRLDALAILFPPLGTVLFFFYNYWKFGNFFIYLKVQSSFGRKLFSLNREHFVFFSHPAITNFCIDVIFLIFVVAGTILVWKRGWYSYAAYLAANVAIILGTGTLIGVGRYTLVLFPIFVALASIENWTFRRIYTLASTLLLAINITLFVNWYWAV